MTILNPRRMKPTTEPCPACGRTHTPNSATVAVGRFTGRPRFRAVNDPDAPLRATRVEAEHDYCQAMQEAA